jgi:hypothetical protein
MARCVKVDDHEDYHHHCYGDYYVSVSVDPFEHVHSAAAATLTPAQRRANARKAARIQIAAGTQMNQQRKKCDHCETWSTPGCIARWHDDNCPRRPGGSQALSSA